MKVEIFCVSFHRDAGFLRYLLRSIQKFATGFAGVTVAVPDYELPLFGFVPELGAKLRLFREWTPNTMMHHEDIIINADLWCPEADAIVFVDSDCIFWEPVTPGAYFVDGKPILYHEPYATLTNKLRLNWKTAVFNATGIDSDYEGMVRHPAVHLPATHRKTRQLIRDHTGKSSTDYILSCSGTFPQSFAEFPTLSTVALHHFQNLYHWVRYDVMTPDGGYNYQRGRDFLVAHWSHGGIERYRADCEAILQ